MKRYGKIYYIRPETIDEYKKDHAEIWPKNEKAYKWCKFLMF